MRSLLLGAAIAATVTAAPLAGVALQNTGTDAWCRNSQYSNDRETFSELREYALPATGTTMSVDASPNGGIRVEGQSRGDIQVLACVSATAETADRARSLAQQVEVIATVERVTARGPEGLERRETWHVSYRLAVPTRSSLSLRTHNGGISLAHLDGDVEFRTVNGGVSLKALNGHVRGRTTNGGVNVELEGATWTGEGLDVETQNGGVGISIPANYSARLETGTVNGRMNIDFPVTVSGRWGRSVEAQIGSGGPLLKIHTSNGGVNVRRK